MIGMEASASRSQKRVKKWVESSFVPDDIVIEIVSRLESKNVVRCLRVCKLWRDLLSTPDFFDLHKQRGMRGNFQMILVDEPKRKNLVDQYFLDKWFLPERKKSTTHRMHRYPLYRTTFSQDGFLVMNSRRGHTILIVNPIYGDEVKIVCPNLQGLITEAYGIFFNPTIKEHCLLLGVTVLYSDVNEPGPKPPPIYYKILNLGPNPCWRDITNPWNFKSRRRRACPVLVEGCIYWMVDPEKQYEYTDHGDIMEFDTTSEEFTLMQYPIQRTTSTRYDPFGLDLLNIDGFLSLVQICRRQGHVNVNIWTLKDRVAQFWTSSNYRVSLDMFSFRCYGRPKSIAVMCGELAIQSDTALSVCNLNKGTTRVFGKKKYNRYTRFFTHIVSLSSLKNCKPMICMEGVDVKDGNKDECKVCDRLDNNGVNKHSDAVEETATLYTDDGKHFETMDKGAEGVGCESGTSTHDNDPSNPTSGRP